MVHPTEPSAIIDPVSMAPDPSGTRWCSLHRAVIIEQILGGFIGPFFRNDFIQVCIGRDIAGFE